MTIKVDTSELDQSRVFLFLAEYFPNAHHFHLVSDKEAEVYMDEDVVPDVLPA